MTDIINGSNVEPMGYQKMDRENNFLNRGQGFLRIQPSIFTRLAGEGPKIVVAHHLEFWSFLGALCSTFPWHVNVFKLNDKTAAFFMDTVKRKNQRKKLVPFISSFIIVVCYWESWILPAELVQFPEPSTSWAYLRYRNYSKPFPGLFFFFPHFFTAGKRNQLHTQGIEPGQEEWEWDIQSKSYRLVLLTITLLTSCKNTYVLEFRFSIQRLGLFF